MWKYLVVITFNLLLTQLTIANICSYAPSLAEQYGNIGGYTESHWFRTYTGGMRITKVIAWWKDQGGYHGALTALNFKLEADDGTTVLGNNGWVEQVILSQDRNGGPQYYDVPAGRTIVRWQQTYNLVGGVNYNTGFEIWLDDGTSERMGIWYDNLYAMQTIRGPLRGFDFYIGGGDIPTIHTIFPYDECACDFAQTSTSVAVTLGASATAPYSLTTQNPGIYSLYGDACDRANWSETTGTGSSVSTISGGSITLGSSDPNTVGQYALNFAWAPENSNTNVQDSFNFAFELQPTCGYSPIIFSTLFLPVTPAIEATTTFQIPGQDIYHQYETTWASAGYPNACTISLELDGPAADYSELDGYFVEVTPPLGTEVGQTTLTITAYYTATQFGTTPDASVASAAQTVDVVIQRADLIETWKIQIIAGLFVANLIFAVITVFMFCRRPIQYKEVKANMPRVIESKRRKADLDLIIFD